MNFNSIQFLIFLPIVSTLYFLIPYQLRWLWLLLASCYFYMAFIPVYILILFLLICIDYVMGILIERSYGLQRKFYLIVSIFSTCLILFIFKYFNFFNANLTNLAQFLHWNYSVKSLSLILPIGLSFHTFQSLGYVIEVYQGKWKAERNFGVYAVYVMFFPQLVSGPIERARNLLPQFYEKHDFDYQRIADGLKLILWGLFQKVVIADRLALLVNQVYGNLPQYQGLPLLIATVFFAFQIYCDFSGYSDIAIGSAQIFGFRLMRNFNQPYFATSIADFWKRWHISLSTWFRDYVYIPLGGNKTSKIRWTFNIIITFLISGLWHGANWTYLIWGALHGTYYLFSSWTKGFRENIVQVLRLNRWIFFHRLLKTLITFSLVCFAWIFFRAKSIQEAGYVIRHLFNGWNDPLVWDAQQAGYLGLQKSEFVGAILVVIFLLAAHVLEQKLSGKMESCSSMRNTLSFLNQKPVLFRWMVYIGMTLAIMNLGVMANVPFIYFQF